MGVTQPPNAPSGNASPFTLRGYGNVDSRSIIKMQRFNFYGSNSLNPSLLINAANASYITAETVGASTHNFVQPATVPSNQTCATGLPILVDNGILAGDNRLHWKETVAADDEDSDEPVKRCVVPFPINMFDTREGLYNEDTAVFNRTAAYPLGAVEWCNEFS